MIVDFPDPDGPEMTTSLPFTSGELGEQGFLLAMSEAADPPIFGDPETLHQSLCFDLARAGHGGDDAVDLHARENLVGLGLLKQFSQSHGSGLEELFDFSASLPGLGCLGKGRSSLLVSQLRWLGHIHFQVEKRTIASSAAPKR